MNYERFVNYMLHPLITILFAHWVADFLFQTEAMALNKSKSMKWLTVHVLTYTIVLLGFSLLLLDWRAALLFAGINGALHGVTDFFTSKLTTVYHHNRRVFFIIIGLDQFIHAAALVMVWEYIRM
ncbi:DUF3307 domain-containing protein [Oscillatoria amoena NRMC-F 0135]|nr:DUF3307 domain-containing protein [Oscillatoria amoena NRMC-F 0135]